jgi:hypothetical protein
MNHETLDFAREYAYPFKQVGWLPKKLDPDGLLSLNQMLEVYAAEYVNIGMEIQSISGHISASLVPDDQLSDADYSVVRDALHRIGTQAFTLNLPVTINLVGAALGSYKRSAPSYGQVKNDIANLGKVVKAELDALRFFSIPPERAVYYSTPPGVSGIDWLGEPTDGLGEGLDKVRDVSKKFPPAEEEFREAGNCFAFERYTACVFHLMRVLEYGLASLASALGVTVTNPNWHQVLTACENQIKTLGAHDPNWKQNEQFYNTAALEFRHFQRAVRNHAAHAHEKYVHDDAKIVMDHVVSFMQHLATRLMEVPMP